jgi:DNA-binding transcriptional LysR family regulator
MALVAAGVGIAIVPEGVARGNPDVAVSKAARQVSTGPSGLGEREEIASSALAHPYCSAK